MEKAQNLEKLKSDYMAAINYEKTKNKILSSVQQRFIC